MDRISSPHDERQAERRHMTVLFCDVVGSTVLSERLDPEEFRDVLIAYQEIVMSSTEKFGGYLARFVGDGVLAYFGYPQALDNSARGAANAALEVIANIRSYRWIDHGVPEPLQVRIGMDTGLVVAGDMASGQRNEIIGIVPHIASRLQDGARPNSVIASAATYELLGPDFVVKGLGDLRLRGVKNSVSSYEIVSSKAAQNGGVSKSSGFGSKFIGRKEEVSSLSNLWERIEQRESCRVGIAGDPGIGKSRLLSELKRIVNQKQKSTVLEFRCISYYRKTPYFAAVEWLSQHVLMYQEHQTTEDKIESLMAYVRSLGGSEEIEGLLLSSFLQLNDKAALSGHLTADAQNARLQTFLAKAVEHAMRAQPTLIVFEDVQWIDPSTLGWIKTLIAHLADEPTLMVFTRRLSGSELEACFEDCDRIIELGPVSEADSFEIIEDVADSAVPHPYLEKITQWAAGNPLYIEELTRTLICSTASERQDHKTLHNLSDIHLSIPSTLAGALMVRLEELGRSRKVAQLASVFCGPFWHNQLLQLWNGSADELEQCLHELINADIISALSDPQAFEFRHALLWEAAYESLLKSERRAYHAEIAKMFESSGDIVRHVRPEILARHFIAAGQEEKAIGRLMEAGQQAVQRSAYLEAIDHLKNAQHFCAKFAAGDDAELDVLILLGAALTAVRGFGSDEVLKCYSRADEVSGRAKRRRERFSSIWGLWVYHLVRAELKKATVFSEELLEIATLEQDSGCLVEGYWTLGNTNFWKGNLAYANELLTKAWAVYDQEKHHPNAYLYGQDPGVSALCYMSFTQWFSGDKSPGLNTSERALDLARSLDHSHTKAWALGFATMTNLISGKLERAEELAEETLAFAERQIMPFWKACGSTFLGTVMSRQGHAARGRQLVEESFMACDAIGAKVLQPLFSVMLAECRLTDGDACGAEAAAKDALDQVFVNGEGICAPLLLNMLGVISRSKNSLEHAKAYWWRAFSLSKSCGAASLGMDSINYLSSLALHADQHAFLRAEKRQHSEQYADLGDVALRQRTNLESYG